MLDPKAMAITHHPDIPTLMTCAAGSQPEALCAVVASHLSVCTSCLRKVSELELIGVALFEALQPAPLTLAVPPLPDGASNLPPASGRLSWAQHGKDIPGPLTGILGPALEKLAWRPMAQGIVQYHIALSPSAGGDLRLLNLAPGVRLHWSSGAGEEHALALRGGYRCRSDRFEPGDFGDFEEATEHQIIADAKHGCALLMASECAPRFETSDDLCPIAS